MELKNNNFYISLNTDDESNAIKRILKEKKIEDTYDCVDHAFNNHWKLGFLGNGLICFDPKSNYIQERKEITIKEFQEAL